MNQKQVWDKIAEPWQNYRFKAVPEVLDFLKNKKGKILDLGCGSGRNLIKNDLIEYFCFDFSEKMLDFAKEAAKAKKIKASFFCLDIGREELPFQKDFFDAAIFVSTLHCIEGEKERRNCLEELFRVLKKGGEAMISVWNKDSNTQLGKLEAKEGFVNWKKDNVEYKRYYYFYDKDELLSLLKEIGFEIIGTGIYGDEKHSKKNIVVYVRKS